MIQGLVFDLDDTLYLERDFVQSGFRSVSVVVETTGVARAIEVFEYLWSGFLAGERGHAFDSLVERWPELRTRMNVSDLVAHYQRHSPVIQPTEPGFVDAIVGGVGPVGLITDGRSETQRNKLAALGLISSFDVQILTGHWGHEYYKPHHRAFIEVEQRLGLKGRSLAYVGDNPAKDFTAPNERGWVTIRVRMPGQLHYSVDPKNELSAPRFEVGALSEILLVV